VTLKNQKYGDAWRLLALPLALLFILPVVMLFVRTPPDLLRESLQMPQVAQAVGVSLRTSLASLALIVLFGSPLAYLIGRHTFRMQRLVDALIDLPTILPPSVAGVALLITFGRRGVVGSGLEALGVQVAFTPLAVVLAQVFIAAPFYVRAAIGFAGVDVEAVERATGETNRWQLLRYIAVMRRALLSGMMSWRVPGRVGATMIFAGNFPGRTDMSTAIYLGFEVDLQVALALSAILVASRWAAAAGEAGGGEVGFKSERMGEGHSVLFLTKPLQKQG
jgi:molybdate transport system permease protein